MNGCMDLLTANTGCGMLYRSSNVLEFNGHWKNMTSFQIWEQHNLAKFAKEANEKLLAQQKEIEQLRDDLRVAIDAYRKLIKEHHEN